MPTTSSPAVPESAPKPRAFVFFDGQNLFHDAEREFAVTHPDFDPFLLANRVCNARGWDVRHIRFYTGVPTIHQNRRWQQFWTRKIQQMNKFGITVVTRTLSYKTISIKLYDAVTVRLPDGSAYPGRFHYDNNAEVPDGVIVEAETFTEKGIDVRIAVDSIRYYIEDQYDAALFFSRDKDLSEAVEEVKRIAKERGKYATLASAFPSNDPNAKGMPGTISIPLSLADYDACRDPKNYFPKA